MARRYNSIPREVRTYNQRPATPEQKALKELMKQYDAKRSEWIILHGDDEGFDDWFTAQVIPAPTT